ncbi:hypothetical protein A2U01_0112079, partial [Trifolium medium]|nr:hypothetical protein [Trifolium medium]
MVGWFLLVARCAGQCGGLRRLLRVQLEGLCQLRVAQGGMAHCAGHQGSTQ